MASVALVVLIGYLIGSVSFSTLIARSRGVDIRRQGSGNPGTTNVIRVLGWRPGLVVLVADLGKGGLAVLIASLAPPDVAWSGQTAQLMAGFAAVVGHIWPVFSRFRGGKGVATAAGVVLATHPLMFAAGAVIFVVLLRTTRWVAVASMGTVVLVTASLPMLWLFGPYRPSVSLMAFCTGISVLIVWAHRTNLTRLRAGEEPKWGQH